MNHCQNCGQINNYGSNFCRFCGTRMSSEQHPNQVLMPPPTPSVAPRVSTPLEYKTPRPYLWKTDEFQVPDANDKKTRQINQVQPLENFSAPFVPPAPAPAPVRQPAPFYQPHAEMTAYGYRCPTCGTQHMPIFTRKISNAGWIVFAVLLLAFFPLFWVGFLIKENVRVCPVCNTRVG